MVMQWNCDHLRSKIPELEQWLQDHGVVVAALQETKLREEDGIVKVRGFEVVRRDRCRGRGRAGARGGGLVTLVKSGWAYEVLGEGWSDASGVEFLGVRVKNEQGEEWCVGNVYVPPEGCVRIEERNILQLPGSQGGGGSCVGILMPTMIAGMGMRKGMLGVSGWPTGRPNPDWSS